MRAHGKRDRWGRRVLAGVLAGMFAAASGAAVAQHSGGHAGAAPLGGGAHQHLDTHFGHNQFYYDRGYSVSRPPLGGYGEFHGRDGGRYWLHGGNWYWWNGRGWIVWGAPFGLFVPFLPPFYTTVWWYGIPYYYANDTYYVWDDAQQAYEVVAPPDGVETSGVTQPPPSDQLFVYPKAGQPPEQQARDRQECQQWARGQSGFDPAAAGGGVPADQFVQKRNDYFRAQVSCLEGRDYTVR